MSKVYYIVGWHQHYENWASSRDGRMLWVCQSTNLAHDGYQSFTDLGDRGVAMFGCWRAIVSFATQCEPRGVLCARGSKCAHSAQTIARRILMSETLVSDTLDHCISSAVQWIGVADSVEAAAQAIGAYEFAKKVERHRAAAAQQSRSSRKRRRAAEKSAGAQQSRGLHTDRTEQYKQKEEEPPYPPEKAEAEIDDPIGLIHATLGVGREVAGEVVSKFGARRAVDAAVTTAEARRQGKVAGEVAAYFRGVARKVRPQ